MISTLAIKLFKSIIVNATLRNSLLCHPYDTPTFKTNTFHLVSYEDWVKHLLLLYINS